MEDADGAGSHLPAVDDLSHDETEGSGSSEESDVFDVRRREDEPWSETASSSEDGHDDEEGDVIEAANDALLLELDADAVTASETSSSPFRRFEEETAKVVNMLRRNPLLPEGVSADAAVRVSGTYCGFAGCDAVGPSAEWVVDHPGKLPRDWLAQHIHHTHLEDLRGMFVAAERCVSASPTTCALCDGKFQERFVELYTRALHTAQERSIPDVGSTVDRRCIEAFYEAYRDDRIESLVCFCCAQIFVRDDGDTACKIRHYKALEPEFLGLPVSVAKKAVGALDRKVYEDRYTQSGFVDEADKESALRPWTVSVPICGTDVEVLCCLEDRICTREHALPDKLCEECEVALCDDCHSSLKIGKLPKLALANDMWVDFMFSFIFENNVTYAELVAASVVHPVMSTMEVTISERWKRAGGRHDLSAFVHKHEGTLGTIGAVTVYVLSAEEILTQIANVDRGDDDARVEAPLVELPLPPKEVAGRLQFRLYAIRDYWTGETKDRLLKEGIVRANVVAELISLCIARGLPGYADYGAKVPNYKEAILKRAKLLYPSSSEPIAELFSVYTEEFESNDITEGKAAVPAPPTNSFEEDPFYTVSAMGIVCGANMHAGMTDNQRTLRGLLHLQDDARRQQRVCGLRFNHNELIETFNPYFFAIAYPFLYSRGGAWIDYKYNPSKRRSPTHGPRVELDDFVRRQCRTIMKQFVRDRTHIFASRDMFQRSKVNMGSYVAVTSEMATRGGEEGANERHLAAELVADINDLLHKLWDSYISERGFTVHVGGDMNRLKCFPGLTGLQQKLLHSYSLVARRIAGTAEARNMMRKYSEGMIVRYGNPIMLTISPNPLHNMLVCHLHRGMKADPIYLREDDVKKYIGRKEP